MPRSVNCEDVSWFTVWAFRAVGPWAAKRHLSAFHAKRMAAFSSKALLRQSGGFEGFRHVGVAVEPYGQAPAEGPKLRELGFDFHATCRPSSREQKAHENRAAAKISKFTRLDSVSVTTENLGGGLPCLPDGRASLTRPLARHSPEVRRPDRVLSDQFERGIPITAIERLHSPLDQIDVVLRHRPRSISH